MGDCEGTIYPGQVKTCTVENYIYERHFDPIQTVGNALESTQIITTVQQSSSSSST